MRDLRDRRRTREDVDIPEHDYAKDHHYYSGPATSRVIPETGISAQKPTASVVSVPTGLQAQNALYADERPHEEKSIKDEIKQAALQNPNRDIISKALEHIQSNEVGTEYFHDTLVDNNKGSYHYQQPIAVKNVVGARNSGGLFSWNGWCPSYNKQTNPLNPTPHAPNPQNQSHTLVLLGMGWREHILMSSLKP